jgi:hypothetical protein
MTRHPLPKSHEIGEEYVKRSKPILHRRLIQAGVRLAWLLNDAFICSRLRRSLRNYFLSANLHQPHHVPVRDRPSLRRRRPARMRAQAASSARGS